MRSSTYIALFAGSAAAQSSVSLFNLFPFQATVTQIGSDATATTYKVDCPSSNAGISVVPSNLRPKPDSPSATGTPAPTARARLARQASPSDDEDYDLCEPYTLKQGPSTWDFHMTDPLPGAWTMDMNCKWQGAITNADLTCTVTQSGYVPSSSVRGVTTSIFSKAEVSIMQVIQPFAVVTSSGAPSATASQTPSGSRSGSPSGSPTGSRSGSPSASGSGSGAAGTTPSTGLAPAGPLPTGAMKFVGGAAGVLAAALAL